MEVKTEQPTGQVIESITVKIGDKSIVFKIDEAKKLKAAFDELFGKEVIKEIIRDNYYPHWRWLYSAPFYYSDFKTCGTLIGGSTQTYVSQITASCAGNSVNLSI